MPALLTIDTLVQLSTSFLLHPFLPILLGLTYAVSTYATPSTILSSRDLTFTLSVPNFPSICIILSFLFLSLRVLGVLDARIARGTRRKIKWEDEVVVIAGGLGGLGGLIAEVYAMRGVPVAVLDIKEVDEKEEERLQEKGLSYWRCDVGDRSAVQKTMKGIEKELGTPTILINNAALVSGSSFISLSPANLNRILQTNIAAHYHTTQALLPGMLARPSGGTIVTISSVLGYTGCAGLSAYTASKAAVTALHRSLSAEVYLLSSHPTSTSTSNNKSTSPEGKSEKTYPQHIKTLLVTPGQLSTPLFRDVVPPSTFLGPVVQVNELAAAIVEKIDRGEGGELSMPLYARWIGLLGVLPAGIGGLVRGMAGLDRAGWAAFVARRGGTEE